MLFLSCYYYYSTTVTTMLLQLPLLLPLLLLLCYYYDNFYYYDSTITTTLLLLLILLPPPPPPQDHNKFKRDVNIPDFVLQGVGENARPMVNFCGYDVVRTIAFMDAGDWPQVFTKYGNSMWLQVKIENNNNVLPDPDVVWLTEHTNLDGEGVLKCVKDGRSKDIHAQLHQLVKDKEKEPEGDQPRLQTQEEILLHVLGPKSGYTRGKGIGYRTSAKARLQEEQQPLMQKQQDQIMNLQIALDASTKAVEDYKEEQILNMAVMEKRFQDMIKSSWMNIGMDV